MGYISSNGPASELRRTGHAREACRAFGCREGATHIQHTAANSPGSSGGGLFDLTGIWTGTSLAFLRAPSVHHRRIRRTSSDSLRQPRPTTGIIGIRYLGPSTPRRPRHRTSGAEFRPQRRHLYRRLHANASAREKEGPMARIVTAVFLGLTAVVSSLTSLRRCPLFTSER